MDCRIVIFLGWRDWFFFFFCFFGSYPPFPSHRMPPTRWICCHRGMQLPRTRLVQLVQTSRLWLRPRWHCRMCRCDWPGGDLMRVTLVVIVDVTVAAVCDWHAPCAAVMADGCGSAAFFGVGAGATFGCSCNGGSGGFGGVAWELGGGVFVWEN